MEAGIVVEASNGVVGASNSGEVRFGNQLQIEKSAGSMEIFSDHGAVSSQPLGERVWSNLDVLSARYMELQKAALPSLEISGSTGDPIQDLRFAMQQSQVAQYQFLELQNKLNSSKNVVDIALSALGSLQQATRTLLQDR